MSADVFAPLRELLDCTQFPDHLPVVDQSKALLLDRLLREHAERGEAIREYLTTRDELLANLTRHDGAIGDQPLYAACDNAIARLRSLSSSPHPTDNQ